ncbi:MAG TPA: hypothetical protein VHE30_01310 [Polyangiaceae bacterium]|nr:hypothetical protein [Polyangiaceae bacterium]
MCGLSIACGHTDRPPPLANPASGTGGASGGSDGSSFDAGDWFASGGARHHSGGRTGAGGAGGTRNADDGGIADGGDVDGGSTVPTGLGSGDFDPESLYLFGTLQEGACYRDAIARVDSPNVFATGFDCYTEESSVALWNRKLVYPIASSTAGLYQFSPDYYGSDPTAPYPTNPEANDVPLDSSGCAGSFAGELLTSPDGRLIYNCPGGDWFEGPTRVHTAQMALIALGKQGLALVGGGAPLAVVQLGADTATPVSPRIDVVAAWHSSGDGFHVVARDTSTDVDVLWSVDAAGNAVKRGEYAAPPSGMQSGVMPWVLTAKDELVRSLTDPPFTDTIYLFRLDGSSTLLYTEANDPTVKVHVSRMFTGP